jgi:hypothetical protein
MSTLRCFPHESMNSRRGSDVPEGGESSGVARLSFHGWFLNPPRGLSKRRGRAAPMVE